MAISYIVIAVVFGKLAYVHVHAQASDASADLPTISPDEYDDFISEYPHSDIEPVDVHVQAVPDDITDVVVVCEFGKLTHVKSFTSHTAAAAWAAATNSKQLDDQAVHMFYERHPQSDVPVLDVVIYKLK